MPNPFSFIEEIREMNTNLSDKLDAVLDQLILLTDILQSTKVDFYDDGR